jgi:hypothetical protein
VTDATIGASACGRCHADIHRRWTGARHGRMRNRVSSQRVVGDFSQGTASLRGVRFTLERDGDHFAIRGPFPTGAVETHRVDYTLGSRASSTT